MTPEAKAIAVEALQMELTEVDQTRQRSEAAIIRATAERDFAVGRIAELKIALDCVRSLGS